MNAINKAQAAGVAQLPAPPKIYGAIAGIIKDIGAVGKNGTNDQQHFKYRAVDDVYSALNPALAKHKVAIIPETVSVVHEERKTNRGGTADFVKVDMKYTIYADDGSYIVASTRGEAMDFGDKATNKAYAAAFKYLCFMTFCIPVQDMIDPDKERQELMDAPSDEKPRSSAKAAKPKPAAKDKPAAEKKPAAQEAADAGAEQITPAMLATIRSEQKRTGVEDEKILKGLHVTGRAVDALTVNEFNKAMRMFQKTKSLEPEEVDEFE